MLDFICISSGCMIKQSLMEVDIGFSMAAAGPSGEIFLAVRVGSTLPWSRCEAQILVAPCYGFP